MFNCYQILCQFWIISFWRARRACYLTALSWLYLAFSMISYLICKLSITLNKLDWLLSASRVEAAELTQIIAGNCDVFVISALKDLSQFFYHLELVLFEFHGIFFPESLGMDWAPFKDIVVEFLHVFLEVWENFYVIFEDNVSVTDLLKKLFVFNVSFQQGINNL